MIQADLKEDYLWRGVLYPKGERLIPEDLAKALGIATDPDGEPDPKSATDQPSVADLTQPSEPEQKPDAIPDTGSGSKQSQGKKRSNQRR